MFQRAVGWCKTVQVLAKYIPEPLSRTDHSVGGAVCARYRAGQFMLSLRLAYAGEQRWYHDLTHRPLRLFAAEDFLYGFILV